MAPSKGKETSGSGFSKEIKEEFRKIYNRIQGTPEQRKQWRIQSADTACEECQEVEQDCVSLTGNATTTTRCERCNRKHLRCSKSRDYRKMLILNRMNLTEDQFYALEQWFHGQDNSQTAPNAPKTVTLKTAPKAPKTVTSNTPRVATQADVETQVDVPGWTVLADSEEEDVSGGGGEVESEEDGLVGDVGGGGGEVESEDGLVGGDGDDCTLDDETVRKVLRSVIRAIKGKPPLEDDPDTHQDVAPKGEPQDIVDYDSALADVTDVAIKDELQGVAIKDELQDVAIKDELQYPDFTDELQDTNTMLKDEMEATVFGMSGELQHISDRLQRISHEYQRPELSLPDQLQRISHEHQRPELSLPDQLQLLRRAIQDTTASRQFQHMTRQEIIEVIEHSARNLGDIMERFGVED
ncbi:hypothetical protein PQX77_006585 [Marasmius sp. AFHP31]|nr:hypothetical protein PQX77_006585 [Marasmius sp. AFHP31]